MKVEWAPVAIVRAEEAARFIAADKPQAALRWLDGLFAAVDRLERHPLSGSRVPEIDREAYRQVVYRSHRVIYRVEKSKVYILTVRHGAQPLRESDIEE